MSVEVCGADCQGYSYLALENGGILRLPVCESLALTGPRQRMQLRLICPQRHGILFSSITKQGIANRQ